jgi:AraC-like DNA-binding protein
MSAEDGLAAEEAMVLGISLLFERFGVSRSIAFDTTCPKTVTRAMAFLQAHACDRVSLEDASKAAGVGLFHLIRLFQKHTGLTPHAYLTQIRITRSRDLLRLGRPVAQIALEVGFADQAHFTKRFKQLTGTTPGAYAKSME